MKEFDCIVLSGVVLMKVMGKMPQAWMSSPPLLETGRPEPQAERDLVPKTLADAQPEARSSIGLFVRARILASW